MKGGKSSPKSAKFAELPLDCKRVVLFMQAPIDQSPRMLAHAWMLAEAGAQVLIVAFGNSTDLPLSHSRIRFRGLAGAGRDTNAEPHWPLLGAVVRASGMTRMLARELRIACNGADLLLAQVPPVLPGLWLAARQGIPLVLDWHNLSTPMAALKLGARHKILPLLQTIETNIGRRAQAHFAVTDALARHLSTRFSRQVYSLPDRPFTSMKVHDVSPLKPEEGNRVWFTVVSATSWSRDEEMELLLDAAERVAIPPGKGLRLVVSGKGPLRARFEERATGMQRDNLHIETAWFSADDYQRMLRHAHCGVSLHRSASGLDFPMKIIDMEAAGLPVLALDYGPVLQGGLAGLEGARTFSSAAQLAGLLTERLNADTWPRYRPRAEDWPAAWKRIAAPVCLRLLQ